MMNAEESPAGKTEFVSLVVFGFLCELCSVLPSTLTPTNSHMLGGSDANESA